MLTKTYSRGALVAWGAAWLFGVIASRGWREPAERLVWTARVGVLAVMMFAVGFGWSRADGGGDGMRGTSLSDGLAGERTVDVKQSGAASAAEDGSVVNRLALWRGGLKMVAAAPLTGWGAGESGRAYMNWYQDLDRDEGYTTMVNSYLHVAVEHGLPVLGIVFWIGIWLLLMAWRGARDDTNANSSALGITRPTLMMGAGASFVAWMGANVFTTLWIEPKLWLVPMVAGLSLFWRAWRLDLRRLVLLTVGSLGLALLATCGLYSAGRWLSQNQSLEIIPSVDGMVTVGSEIPGQTGKTWHVWSDTTVAGLTPGKEMRRWLLTQPQGTRLISRRADSLRAEDPRLQADGVMLFGRQVERLGHGFAPDCRELWLIHPLGSPPVGQTFAMRDAVITVLLPAVDETGNGLAWRRWATQNGARVAESASSGLDIRAAWPEVLNLDSNQPLAKGSKAVPESSIGSQRHL